MINRATFYYHFEDIYDLLDKVLSEVLLINLDSGSFQQSALNEETLLASLKQSRTFSFPYQIDAIEGMRIQLPELFGTSLKLFFIKC